MTTLATIDAATGNATSIAIRAGHALLPVTFGLDTERIYVPVTDYDFSDPAPWTGTLSLVRWWNERLVVETQPDATGDVLLAGKPARHCRRGADIV